MKNKIFLFSLSLIIINPQFLQGQVGPQLMSWTDSEVCTWSWGSRLNTDIVADTEDKIYYVDYNKKISVQYRNGTSFADSHSPIAANIAKDNCGMDVAEGKLFYVDDVNNQINSISFNNSTWNVNGVLNGLAFPALHNSDIDATSQNSVWYAEDRGRVCLFWNNGTSWNSYMIDWNAPIARLNGTSIAKAGERVFYINNSNKISYFQDVGSGQYINRSISMNSTVAPNSNLIAYSRNIIYFVDQNQKIFKLHINDNHLNDPTDWYGHQIMDANDVSMLAGSEIVLMEDNYLSYIGIDDKLYGFYYQEECDANNNPNTLISPAAKWHSIVLNSSISANGNIGASFANGKLFYADNTNNSRQLHQLDYFLNNSLGKYDPVQNSYSTYYPNDDATWGQPILDEEFDEAGIADVTNLTNDWYARDNYIRGSHAAGFSDDLKYIKVENGILKINAYKDSYNRSGHPTKPDTTVAYTSGELNSGKNPTYNSGGSTDVTGYEEDGNYKYGYFEMRCKIPKGKGFFPSFWLSAHNGYHWDYENEIDIFEVVGESASQCNPYENTGSIHWPANPPSGKVHEEFIRPYLYSYYHTFAVEWTPSNVKFYLNNVLVGNAASSNYNIPNNDLRIVASFQIPNWNLPNDIDLPATWEIDYIKVWQKDIYPSPSEIGDLNEFDNNLKNLKTNIYKDSGILVYPNPSNGNFTIINNLELNENTELVIVNLLGEVVFQKTVNNNKTIVDLSEFSKGVYLIKLITIDSVSVDRLILE